MWKLSLTAVLLLGCTKATPTETPNPDEGKQGMAPPPSPPPAPPKPKATIELSSVTFADDCGGTVPLQAPKPVPGTAPADSARAPAAPATMVAPSVVAEKRRPGAAAVPEQVPMNRRCEQTSLQLVVVATDATDIAVKSVTVFDEVGKELGSLTTSKPSRWATATSTYEAWDQKVAAGQTTQASYVLSQPAFINRYEYKDKTYTVKVVASVGGVEQPLQTSVLVVGMPVPVPT